MTRLTRQQIIDIATGHDLFVHVYSWRQESLRKKCRRMVKDGYLKAPVRQGDVFVYRATEQAAQPGSAETG